MKKSDFESENEHLDKLWGCPFRSNQSKEIKESMDLEGLNFRVSQNDDVQFNSPSSVVSSDRNDESIDEMDEDDEDDDEDLMSSYVIEIDSCNRGTSCESNDVDEAIAWAKEKFHQHCSQEKIARGKNSSFLTILFFTFYTNLLLSLIYFIFIN